MSSATPLSTLDVSTTTPAHLNWILNQLTEIRYDGWKIPTYKLTVQQRLDQQQQHQNEEEIAKSTNENTKSNKAKTKTEVEEVEETAPAPPLPIQPGTTLEAHRVTEFLCSRIIAHSPALESRRDSLEQIFSTIAAKNLISNTFWLLFLEFFALTDGVARVMAYRHVVGGLMDELHGTCDDRQSNMALTNPAQIQILENALRSGVQPGNALTHGFLSSCGFVTMDVSGVQTSGSGANSTKATTAKNVSQVPMPHHLTPRILDNVEDFDWENYHRRKLLYGGADGETDHTSSNYDSDDEEGHSRHSKQQRSTSRSTNGNKKEHGRSSSRASSKNARKNHETRRELCEEEARKKFLRGRSKSVMEDSPEVMLQMLNYKQQATKETSKIVISGLERVQTRVRNDGINDKNTQQPGPMRRTLSGRQLIIRAPGASISKENEKAAPYFNDDDDDDDDNATDSDNGSIDEKNSAQKKLFGSFNTSRPKSTETTTTTTSKTSKPRSNHNRQRKPRPRSTSTTGSTTSGPSGRTSPSSASGASSSRSVMTATMITSRKSPRKKVRCTSRASSLFLGEHQNASVTPGTIMSLVLTIGNSVDSTSSGENNNNKNNNNDKSNSASIWKKSAASVLPGSIASAAHSAVFGMTRAVLEEIVRTKMQDSQFKPYSGRTEATAALRLLRDSGILEKVQCRRLLLDKFITSVDAESISKKRGVVLAAMEAVAEEQNKIFTHMSFNFVAVMQKLAPRGHVSSFSVPRDMVLPFLSDALAQTFCALIFDCFPYLRGEMKLETRRAVKRHASFWFDGVDKDEVGHWGFHFVRPKLMLRDGAEHTTLNGIKVGQSEQNILADVGTHRNSRRKHGRKYSPTNSTNNNNLSTSRVESPLQGSLSPARSTSPISPSTKYFMAKADMRHNSVNNNNNNFLLQQHQTPVKPSTSQSQHRPFGVSSTARAGASSNQNRRGKISPINRPRSRQQRPHTTIAFAAALSPGASIPSNSMMMAVNQNMRRRTNSISGGSTGMNNNNNSQHQHHQHQNGGNNDAPSNTVIPFFAGVTSIPGPRNARAELTKLFSSIEDEQRQERHEKREEQRLREIETARLRHAREMQMSAMEKAERANRKKFGSKSSHPVAGFGDDKVSFRPGLVSSTSAFMASAVSINNNNNNASTTSPKPILAPLVINPSSGAPGKSGLIPSPPSFSKNSNFNASELYAQIDTTLNKNKNENGVTSPASTNTYKLPSTMISSRSATNTKVIGENYFGVNNNNNNNTPQNQSPKQPNQFPLPSDDPNQNSIFFVVPPALLVNGVPIQSFNVNNNRGNAEQEKQQQQQQQNNANNNLNSATQTFKPENAPDGDGSISQSQAQNLMTSSTSQILVPSPPPLKQKATRVPSSIPLGKKKISFVQSSNFPPSTNYAKSNNNHNDTANESQSHEKGIIEVINSSSFFGNSNITFINSNADSNGDDASRISHKFGPSKSSLGSQSVSISKQLDRSAKETETRGRPQVSKPDKQFSVRDFSRQRARHQQRALELKKAEAIANNHRFAPSRQPDAHWHRYGASRRPPPSATMAMTTGDDFFAEGEFHIGLLSPIMERFCEEQNMRSARDVTLKYPSKMQWSFLVKMHGNSMYGENFGKNANNNNKKEEE